MHIYEKQSYSPAASAAAPPPPVAVKGFCYSLPSRRDHLSFAKMLRLPPIKWIAIYGLSWGPTSPLLLSSCAMCDLTLLRFQTYLALSLLTDRPNRAILITQTNGEKEESTVGRERGIAAIPTRSPR